MDCRRKVEKWLETASKENRERFAKSILDSGTLPLLAIMPNMCHIVQSLLLAPEAEYLHGFARVILSNFDVLYSSPNGHWAVRRLISVADDIMLVSVIQGIERSGPVEVASGKFGGRIVEEVFETAVLLGKEELPEMNNAVDRLKTAIIDRASDVAQGEGGNYVLQKLMKAQHLLAAELAEMVQKLVQILPSLARLRFASHVVEDVLRYDETGVAAHRLLSAEGPDSIVELAKTTYGMHIVWLLTTLSDENGRHVAHELQLPPQALESKEAFELALASRRGPSCSKAVVSAGGAQAAAYPLRLADLMGTEKAGGA